MIRIVRSKTLRDMREKAENHEVALITTRWEAQAWHDEADYQNRVAKYYAMSPEERAEVESHVFGQLIAPDERAPEIKPLPTQPEVIERYNRKHEDTERGE
jgi:hypothetical protein